MKSPVFAYRRELDRWMRRYAREEIASGIDERLAATKERRDKLFAIQQRVRFWRTSSKQRRVLEDNFAHMQQNRFTFMSTDLDAAMTLEKIAKEASDKRKRARNEANARRALDTVLHLYGASQLTEDERNLLDGKIGDLRAALERITSRAMP